MGDKRRRARALYIPHGGGPLPLLGDPQHGELVAGLKGLGERLRRPKTIIVVSAHWEGPQALVTSAAEPGLLYDYYGFPKEAYRLSYPAPGDPDLAARVIAGLCSAGVSCAPEAARGLDHGVFVPLALMYPEADIPCLQLSLLSGLDPSAHLALGRALAKAVGDEDVLILGSGFSFHNMREFFQAGADEPDSRNEAFQAWLRKVCIEPGLSEAEREAQLADWERAPHARYCHPREEHLLPLHVCAGFAGRAADRSWTWRVLGKEAMAFLWEA